ncbi:hypothetical protein BSIN_5234 [Burkholderia singularis]|uniref:Uncharacterized protein n=1 Tax=Burkholderia singularis TaxID=1503053 RepID=A0A238HBX4_9BURK|nr:hypothetical protein BSIN_5234 [Burkholderia singularis]
MTSIGRFATSTSTSAPCTRWAARRPRAGAGTDAAAGFAAGGRTSNASVAHASTIGNEVAGIGRSNTSAMSSPDVYEMMVNLT